MTLHVFELGPDHYIAYDADDVFKLAEEQHGMTREDLEGEEPIQLAPTDTVSIAVDNDGRICDLFDQHEMLKLTCEEWIKREGRGFLCSTEY